MEAAAPQQAGQGQPEPQQKLKIDKFADGGTVCLKFAGSIDEDFDGKKTASSVKAKTLVLDLAEIHKISSFGIHEWVDFMNALEKHAESIVLLECAPKVVDQLNMVANFAGTGQVVLVRLQKVPTFKLPLRRFLGAGSVDRCACQ